MPDKQQIFSRVLFLFLLLIAAVSYSNTLYSPFILDDYSAFVDNRNLYLKDLSFESLAQLFHTRFGSARVLPIASFALNHYIGQGESIVNYHVTNILVHLLTTTCIAFLLSGLLKTRGALGTLRFFRPGYFILAVCGLWALSPLQTNAVTYLVQRMTSMAAMFYVLSCTLYIHARLAKTIGRQSIYFGLFLFSAICAFLSKENSWILPLALLLIEFIFVSPDLGPLLLHKARWYHWAILLLAILLVSPPAISYFQEVAAGFYGRHFTLPERLYTELRIVVFYMSLLLLPLPGRMSLDHDFSLSTSLLAPPATLLSLLVILGLLGAAFYLRRRLPFISFGIFWFFLNLVIESTFIPLELIFEHRLYLPSIGFFIALVSGADILLARHAAKSHPEIGKIVFLIFIIILSLSSILTSVRNNDWRDKLSIYRDAMEKAPDKPRAVSNYAMANGKAGNYDECVEYGMMVQSLGVQGHEDYMNAATNTLSCLLLQKKYREAVETGEQIRARILAKDLDYIQAGSHMKYMFNLGQAYVEEGNFIKGLQYLSMALFRAPSDGLNYLAVNRLLLKAQQDEQGRADLNLGENTYDIPIRLAKISYNYRQYERALLYLQDAGKLGAPLEEAEPLLEKVKGTVAQNRDRAYQANIANNSTYASNSSFRIYLKAFDFILRRYKPLKGAFAGWLLDRAEQIDPQNPFMPVYRARWYMANDDLDSAIAVLQEALAVDENFLPVLEQLGVCFQQKKDYEKSVALIRRVLELYHGNNNWVGYQSYIYQYEDKINETGRTPLDYY